MVQQLLIDGNDVSSTIMDSDLSILEAAEDLVHALLGVKRRLSLSSSNAIGTNYPRPCQWPTLPQERQTNASKKRRLFKDKKKVRFSDEKRLHIVENSDDIKESLRERWYQEDEYQRIKDDYLKTLVAYTKVNMKTSELDESEHCLRGLETQISILILRMPYRNRQKKVVKSVLHLQQIQKSMKQEDTAALREMSLIVSNQDNLQAIKNASGDLSLTGLL